MTLQPLAVWHAIATSTLKTLFVKTKLVNLCGPQKNQKHFDVLAFVIKMVRACASRQEDCDWR